MDIKNCTVFIQNNIPGKSRSLSLLDILLDETLTAGTVYVPCICFQKVSALNSRLPAKQTYEFLLRLASVYPVFLSDKAPDHPDSYFILNTQETDSGKSGLKTDCYIAARYKKILLEHNCFNKAVSSILTSAQQLGCQEQIIPFLENMLQEQNYYQYFFQGSQPFLIYTGDDICYRILSVFAEYLGRALQDKGCLVEYFDLSEENFTAASRYIGQSFQAVIGIQTYMFSARLKNGQFLHDKIIAPKYNFIFDHPVWLQHHLKETPDNLTVFTLDRNYVSFIQKHYPVNVRFLPPGGIAAPLIHRKRIYDVAFVASYINNAEDVAVQLKLLNRPMRLLVNRFWLNMRRHPELPAEYSLLLALKHYNRVLSNTEFTELFHSFRSFILYMSYHYRYKLVKTLIDSEIQVHVFGTTWKTCPLLDSPNLIWHEADLSTDECLNVWQQTKIALNIMSWHKNAITERVANSMLQEAAVLTERNPYLEDQFQDGEDLIFYDLSRLEELPVLIHTLLASPERLAIIGANGRKKALQSHTWSCRAEELLNIVLQDASSVYDVTSDSE